MRSTVICTAVDTVCDAVGNAAALTFAPNPLSLGLCLRPFRACVPAIARAYVSIAQPIPSGKPLPAEENCRDHQADLPAQQPSSFEDARLPPAYEHPRWPRNPGCTPSQGPRPPLRLSFREVLPRSNRMVNPADFRLAIRSGSRAGQQRLIVHCRTDEDSDSRLVGFVVPKSQIKRAVGRNRVKRQLRHLMKERLGALPQGARVVVRVKHDALGASSCELGEELDQVLRRAWKKWDHREGGRP